VTLFAAVGMRLPANAAWHPSGDAGQGGSVRPVTTAAVRLCHAGSHAAVGYSTGLA